MSPKNRGEKWNVLLCVFDELCNYLLPKLMGTTLFSRSSVKMVEISVPYFKLKYGIFSQFWKNQKLFYFFVELQQIS